MAVKQVMSCDRCKNTIPGNCIPHTNSRLELRQNMISNTYDLCEECYKQVRDFIIHYPAGIWVFDPHEGKAYWRAKDKE